MVSEEAPVFTVKELLPRQSMVPEVETPILSVDLEVTTPTTAVIEPEGPAADSFEESVQFPSFPTITKGNFW